ncbi:MAG: ComEA family DNA-binding protein [Defluviitaleaceae bacterium]|nr:ComEA family DNA-binding protein [Defluviitaleaceae bacterium]
MKEFIKQHVYIILGVALILLMGGLFVMNGQRASSRTDNGSREVLVSASDGGEFSTQPTADAIQPLPNAPSYVVVDVVGAVYQPGVFTLPADARVIHAIEAAGGYTAYAFRAGINGAAEIFDAMQIYVPTLLEDGTVTGHIAMPGAAGAVVDDGLLCLNTATYAQLRTLHQIGTARATAILNHREALGGFANVDQLLDITGISHGILDPLRPYIIVR